MVLDTWRQAAENTKWRLHDSHLVWDQYIDLMMEDQRRNDLAESAATIKSLFEQRLRVPHSNWDSTFQNFSSFISSSNYFKNDYEQIMVETSKSGADAKAKLSVREETRSRA